MRWFANRAAAGLVPGDILAGLGAFGRASLEAKVRGQAVTDPRYDWSNFFARFLPAYQANLTRAIAEVHAAAGDDLFARYGGYRLVAEFEPGSQDALYLDLMDAGLTLMYDQKLSSGYLTGYEADRWVATHGDLRTSFDRIVEVAPPGRHAAAGVSLGPGASLMVARMGPGALDNEFYVGRTGEGRFCAFSMRKRSSDDVVLTRCEEPAIPQSDTAEGVLQSLGRRLRLRPYWAHEQLEPFFPERRDI